MKKRTRSGVLLQKIQKTRQGKLYLSKEWHMRIQHRGTRKWVPLDENFQRAEGMANDLIVLLDSSHGPSLTIDEAVERLADGGLRRTPRHITPRNSSTLEELRDLAPELAGAMNIVADSAAEYVRSIYTIVRAVLEHRSGKRIPYEKVGQQPIALLTGDFLTEFKQLRCPPKMANHGTASRKQRNSANRHIRNSQALLEEERLEMFRAKGLTIPPMDSYRGISAFKGANILSYTMPPADLIVKVSHAIVTELPKISKNLFCAALLGQQAGLRPDEIRNCRKEWFSKDDHGHIIRVRKTETWSPKFGKERDVRVHPWLPQQIQENSASTDEYVLSDFQKDQNESITAELARWLRQQGMAMDNPVQDLRRWFASFCATEWDITKAQRQLGHSTPMITSQHYAAVNFPRNLAFVWKSPETLGFPLPKLLMQLQPTPEQIQEPVDKFGFPLKQAR